MCEKRMYHEPSRSGTSVHLLARSSAYSVRPFWCVRQLLVCLIHCGCITNVGTPFISSSPPPHTHTHTHTHTHRHTPPAPFPFSTFVLSVTDACFLPCRVGAHGWVARISQPWERSLSRSWLPIVEAPGYHRHPTATKRRSC